MSCDRTVFNIHFLQSCVYNLDLEAYSVCVEILKTLIYLYYTGGFVLTFSKENKTFVGQ